MLKDKFMEITRLDASLILDKIDELNDHEKLIELLGGATRLSDIHTFYHELIMADMFGKPTLVVTDSLYKEFSPKILGLDK